MTAAPAQAGILRLRWWLFLLPACFLVEVILGGPLGMYGGMPVRFILFGACGVELTLGLGIRVGFTGAHLVALASVTGFLSSPHSGSWSCRCSPAGDSSTPSARRARF